MPHGFPVAWNSYFCLQEISVREIDVHNDLFSHVKFDDHPQGEIICRKILSDTLTPEGPALSYKYLLRRGLSWGTYSKPCGADGLMQEREQPYVILLSY